MDPCLWCLSLPNDAAITATLTRYCNGDLSPKEKQEANDDLIRCPECVVEYHKARERVPELHKSLWDLETARLRDVFQEMLEVNLEDCDLYFVDNGQEEPVSKYSPEDLYNRLRFPLMEVLKYPYLLCHRELCEMVVNLICKMEDMKNPLPVHDQYQGTYLLMVHPNKMVRHWAIATARQLGRMDRDKYYELQEVFSCMFRILDLGITLDFISTDDSYISGKLQLLPPHLYESKNKKNYWLGICMLLMQLDSQAMISLLMGPDGQASIPQCIINTMTDCNKDCEGSDPFWPALHCFLVILDRLGSKIWGQIEPLDAFRAISEAGSYKEEIETIRKKTAGSRVKVEPETDDLLSCSQIVYDCYATERTSRSSDYSSGNTNTSGNAIFEEISCLVNVLQSEMGQGMRVYGSTFLWFIPFVRSIMELNMFNSICMGEIIHYLNNNVNKDVLSGQMHTCDKVTEFFIRILVDIIELHLSKGCMEMLSYFTHIWVDLIMQCALLPADIGNIRITPRSGHCSTTAHFGRGNRMAAAGFGAVSQACLKLILSLLKEGGRTETVPKCAHFLKLLKRHQHGVSASELSLSKLEYENLKKCLNDLIKAISEKPAVSSSIPPCAPPTPPAEPSENLISYPDSTLTPPLQQEHTREVGIGPSGLDTSFIKIEPQQGHGECQDSFCDSHEKESRPKQEPFNPVPISEIRPEVNRMKPDFGKIQEIRSRFNEKNLSRIQSIANRKCETVSSGLKEMHELASSESPQCSTSQTKISDSESLSKPSERQFNDEDEPLDVRKHRLKRCFKSIDKDSTDASHVLLQSSSSEKKVHEDYINTVSDGVSSNDQQLLENRVTHDAPLDIELKSPGRDYDDLSESQVFEFETQEDMASVWDEPHTDIPVVSKKHTLWNESKTCFRHDSGELMETQPVSDEVIEKACLQVSKQQHPQISTVSSIQVPLKPSSNEKCDFIPSKHSQSASEKPGLTDKCKQLLNRKPPVIEALSQKTKKHRRSHNSITKETVKPCSSTMLTSPSTIACPSSTPAIVPPKKVRKRVEPEFAPELLGLKKKERKAFEFSQRSLDSLGELRSYGQNVHVVPQQKSKRVPQQKGKKLLASQDMQYFRQRRGMLQKSSAATFAKSNKCPAADTLAKSKPATEITKDLTDEEEDYSFLPCSQPDPDRRLDSKMGTTHISTHLLNDSKKETSENTKSKELSFLQHKVADGSMAERVESKDENCGGGDDDYDDDWWALTQNEPTDMELCSQMEQLEEEHGEIFKMGSMHNHCDSYQPNLPEGETSVPVTSSDIKKSLPEASTVTSSNGHSFIKSNMLTDCQKKPKPSTTKIYTSSSRSASLAKEMRKVANPLPAANIAKAKVARPPPAMLPPPPKSTPQHEFRLPLPPRPSNYHSNHISTSSRSSVASVSQVPTYKTYPRPEAPVSNQTPTVDRRFDRSRMFEPPDLKQAILKWDFSMFENYESFGTPTDLCPFPLKEVPTKFSSYQEYFQIMYPLLLINTFEEMVTEWLKRGKIRIYLQVQGIEYCSRIASASFTAKLNAEQEMKQLYPKDDDLVLLWLPENTGAYANDEPQFGHEPTVHFGCVSQSSVLSNRGGQFSTLKITIQTRGNVSSINTQPICCVPVGSLISTLREFRGLCLLQKSKMLNQILTPDARFVASCQDGLPNLDMPEYNADQSKAINCGVALVKRQQNTPKVLLVRGPPGTGKSKVIVGILHGLLSDGESLSVNRHAKAHRKRILLCAPSNAAIDSLMKKIIIVFKEKCLVTSAPQGNCGDINLVRLGSERTICKSLIPFSLDSQVKKGLEKNQQKCDLDSQRKKEELDKIIEELSQDCAKTDKKSQRFEKLNAARLDHLKEREKLSKRLNEFHSKRRVLQSRLLQDAHVICCTLSTSGSPLLADSAFRQLGQLPFNCVIVDEAGQAKETETLIPLLYRCPNLILVGDPEQLPPTVLSWKAKELGYDQSLMARILNNLNRGVHPSIFLSVQYRMHPDICAFPSKYIYGNKLKSDRETALKLFSSSWPFEPYRVFDVTDGRESKEGDSFSNMKEVKLVLLLYTLLGEKNASRKEKQSIRVGIITPYNAQKKRILQALEKETVKELQDKKYIQVDVDTVDGFQGREIDCVIVSCVRAGGENGNIGFVGSRKRMNVTITRAKSSLFILGHLRTLRAHSDWGALIEDAKQRGTIISAPEADFHRVTQKVLKPIRHPSEHRRYSVPAPSDRRRDHGMPSRHLSVDQPAAPLSSREQDGGAQRPPSHSVQDPRVHQSAVRSFRSPLDQRREQRTYSSSASSRTYKK